MRQSFLLGLGLCAVTLVAGCENAGSSSVDRALESVNAVDEANLSDIMLTVADPNEAVTYFARSTKEKPDRLDLKRGLALSLVRAKRYDEAVGAWRKVVKHEDSTNDDMVDLADALIRKSDWQEADKTLDQIPPTHETFKRYRLEAMVADSDKEWKRPIAFMKSPWA
jgi:thioredoxin-like negative regulator of GroEL